jgi:hypothetical protein
LLIKQLNETLTDDDLHEAARILATEKGITEEEKK